MMSFRVVNAGDGYAYLLRSVATADADTNAKTKLGDYYQATGTPPGRWFGRGLSALESPRAVANEVVEEDQMAALYGEGLHPDADEMIRHGASLKDVQLGRAYPLYTGGDEVLQAIHKAEKDFRYAHDRRPSEDERNMIALDVARPYYEADTGYTTASAKEVLAWVNEKKNSIRQATAGFDLTFSPTKSISVLWAVADEDTRKTIEAIHQSCVNDALTWVEENALFTRCETNGVRQLARTQGMIAAQFLHYDTRAGDPDLHTHCLVSNKVLAPDGKWRSVDSRSLFKNAVTASSHYDALMMQRITDTLGYSFVARDKGENKQPVWEIAGIDHDVLDHFSKRREGARPVFEQLCADYHAKHGRYPSQRAARKLWQQAVLDTRPAKDEAKSLYELRAQWREEIGEHFGAHAVSDMLHSAHSQVEQRAQFPLPAELSWNDTGKEHWQELVRQQALEALDIVATRRSDFSKRHVETAVLQHLSRWRFADDEHRHIVTHAVVSAALEQAVDLSPAQVLAVPGRLTNEDGVAIDRDVDSKRYTTQAVLDAEKTVLDSAQEPTAHLVERARIDEIIARYEADNGFVLNTGQRALVDHLTASGMQTVAGVGAAGTGKTASMAVVADIWRAHGHTVHALAPSAVAAKTLGNDVGAAGHTLASLTYRWRGKDRFAGQQCNLSMLSFYLGVPINPGDMLLVDEAGMASTDDLAAVVEIAQEAGAVVRMVGDPYQLDAVETGGLFRTVCTRTGAVELDQVMRQGDDTEQAEAGKALRHGDSSGLDVYDKRGWIHAGARPDMLASAVSSYLDDRARGRHSLLIASTNETVNSANRMIQSVLIEQGVVQANSSRIAQWFGYHPPSVELADATAWVGDTILTRRNARLDQPDGGVRDVLNGEHWTVEKINRDGSLVVASEEKQRSVVLGADYVRQHCQLGYAATIHRCQGVTVDTTHAVVEASTDRRGLYVAVTRGRKENHVYAVTAPSIDEGEEEAHLHMDGDDAPLTGVEMLRNIVEKDDGFVSATEVAEQLAAAERSPERLENLLATAKKALAHDYATSVTASIVDRLPVDIADSLTEEQTGVIYRAVSRAGSAGADIRDQLDQIAAVHGNEQDLPVVIAYRVDNAGSDVTSAHGLPPLTSQTDTEMYGFAVSLAEELAAARSRENTYSVTVMDIHNAFDAVRRENHDGEITGHSGHTLMDRVQEAFATARTRTTASHEELPAVVARPIVEDSQVDDGVEK